MTDSSWLWQTKAGQDDDGIIKLGERKTQNTVYWSDLNHLHSLCRGTIAETLQRDFLKDRSWMVVPSCILKAVTTYLVKCWPFLQSTLWPWGITWLCRKRKNRILLFVAHNLWGSKAKRTASHCVKTNAIFSITVNQLLVNMHLFQHLVSCSAETSSCWLRYLSGESIYNQRGSERISLALNNSDFCKFE